MPRYIATVTVNGKQYNAKATADSPSSAHQKICASAWSAFPGKQITVGYATEEKSEIDRLFGKMPKVFKDIFK